MERFLKKKLKGGKFVGVSASRSALMGRIRSYGNRSTEKALRFALVRWGIRGWKLHARDVYGKPDFLFPESKIAVFVDGCFWHGCARCGHIPRTNSAFWSAKVERNRQRAGKVRRKLRKQDYRVIRVWEHDLNPASIPLVVKRLAAQLAESDRCR